MTGTEPHAPRPAAAQLKPWAVRGPRRGTLWELRAAGGPEKMHYSELTYASTHAYLGIAGRGTSKGTAGHGMGPEELRDSA